MTWSFQDAIVSRGDRFKRWSFWEVILSRSDCFKTWSFQDVSCEMLEKCQSRQPSYVKMTVVFVVFSGRIVERPEDTVSPIHELLNNNVKGIVKLKNLLIPRRSFCFRCGHFLCGWQRFGCPHEGFIFVVPKLEKFYFLLSIWPWIMCMLTENGVQAVNIEYVIYYFVFLTFTFEYFL